MSQQEHDKHIKEIEDQCGDLFERSDKKRKNAYAQLGEQQKDTARMQKQ